MLIYEYKVDATKRQEQAIEEAIRVTQFVRNKALRLWMDTRGTNRTDLQCLCASLAQAFPFVSRLNSQARQAAADRAWFAISRFYDNCQHHKPGKKGYPQFQHDNRSVEYKQTGWKLEPDGKHLTFTDGCGIGRVRLVGNTGQQIETFPMCPGCGVVLDRDHNAALNILAKALEGTGGQSGTSVSSETENAWGEVAATGLPALVVQHAFSWNQEPPVF